MLHSFAANDGQAHNTRLRDVEMPLEQREMRAERVLHVIHERNRRAEFFRRDMFSDPAWDILLEVYASDLMQQRSAMSDIGVMSNVPQSTANRWLKLLEGEGLLSRSIDPLDSRRIYVELTLKGTRAMAGYFRAGSG